MVLAPPAVTSESSFPVACEISVTVSRSARFTVAVPPSSRVIDNTSVASLKEKSVMVWSSEPISERGTSISPPLSVILK